MNSIAKYPYKAAMPKPYREELWVEFFRKGSTIFGSHKLEIPFASYFFESLRVQRPLE